MRAVVSGHRVRLLGISLLGAAGLCYAALAAAPPARAATECDTITDALRKFLATNARQFGTQTVDTLPGIATKVETIHADGVAYLWAHGQWIKNPMTLADLQKQNEDTLKNHPVCKWLRDETLDGQPTAVYSELTTTAGIKVDSTLWISKASGLPLQQDVTSDTPAKKGKLHAVTRFEYENVKAPELSE